VRKNETREKSEKAGKDKGTPDLHARRQAYDVIRQRTLVKKLFDEIGPEFSKRNGGYTRVLKLGTRKGDGAQLAVLELLMEKPVKVTEKEKKEIKKEPKETKAKSKKKTEKKEK